MAEPREKAGFSLDRLLGNPELIAGLLSLFGSRLTGEGRTDEIPEPYRDGAEAAAAPYGRQDAGAAETEELPVSAEPEEGGAPPEAAEGEEASIAVSGMPSPPVVSSVSAFQLSRSQVPDRVTFFSMVNFPSLISASSVSQPENT